MRLSQSTLTDAKARLPDYDRDQVETGIIHLGIGAFHRAHQAVVIDDLLAQDPSWGIIGASLRSPKTADALNPQNGLYTLVSMQGQKRECRVIGSVCNVLAAQGDARELVAKMALPEIRVISLTVTEKGYCHVPATGQLDLSHPDVIHDLENPANPVSAVGIIASALARRKENGIGPFTVMSCDNLPHNGVVTRQVVQSFADRLDPSLAVWIREHVTFPSTMVDRIVPSTTDADRELVEEVTGLQDAWPVMTEPFWQWVIEDNFCAGRPAFETAGVLMTDDVTPFELMKLRLLNGSHSALAYMGLLAGHETVSDAMADEGIAKFISDIMRLEIAPTLDGPVGVDLKTYQSDLLERFKNPSLNHKLAQIAMDGSQKLPQRILDTIRDRMAAGLPFERLAKVISAWRDFIYLKGEDGFLFELNDPLAQELRAAEKADLTKNPKIFGTDLSRSQAFHETVNR